MAKRVVPERGDLVWIEFSPQLGHEQGGHRPALVVTPRSYNEASGLMLACPVTSQVKDYPFEVLLPTTLSIKGAILVDQMKCLDWRLRNFKFIEHLPSPTLDEVLSKLDVLIKNH
ncbi:MAG: type II toxin-antitoxin system PemK/MazF family toxin [Pirellulales bacterium]|nr:type II toxin-antitoxin system PemK/MazF family toxin [Pirellulales bacterium]